MASARRKPPLTGATVRRSNRRDRRVTLRSFCPSNLLTQCDRALRSKTTGTGAPQRSCSPVIPQNLRRFRTSTQKNIARSHKVRTKISVTIAHLTETNIMTSATAQSIPLSSLASAKHTRLVSFENSNSFLKRHDSEGSLVIAAGHRENPGVHAHSDDENPILILEGQRPRW